MLNCGEKMSKLSKITIILYLLFLFFSITIKMPHLANNNLLLLNDSNVIGDLNNDTYVNSLDYIIIRQYLLNNTQLTDYQRTLADANQDGDINSLDYITIRKIILNNAKTDSIFTATFVIQDPNAVSVISNEVSCTTNGSSTCEIIPPTLTANKGYEAIGWNTDKNSTTSVVNNSGKIVLGNSGTFYSISRNKKQLTASFEVQDGVIEISGKEASCYLYNGSKSCEVTSPTLISHDPSTTIIGWNTDSKATTALKKNGEKISISKNIKYYTISSTAVSVTFSVGENIEGNNTKATALSFYNNEHTKCTSYNGNGCNIKWVPTIIAPGNVVHGFSQTPDGAEINVAKTKFKQNTTLYARVYDKVDGSSKISSFRLGRYEVVGNIVVEVEAGLSERVTTDFINFVKNIYQDFPSLFMWNGTITLLTQRTYQNMYGKDSGGITNHGTGFSKDFSHISTYYSTSGSDINYHLGTVVHEITHAYNYGIYWNGGMDSAISKTSDINNIYNKYKNGSSRPLTDYAYTNTSEFFSEIMREYYRRHRNQKYNDYPYKAKDNNGRWENDLGEIAEKYIKFGLDYYRSIGKNI